MRSRYIFADWFEAWIAPYLQPAIERSLALFPDHDLFVATFGMGRDIYRYGPLAAAFYIAAVLIYLIRQQDLRRAVMLFSLPGFAMICMTPWFGQMWLIAFFNTFNYSTLNMLLMPTVYVFCLMPFLVFLTLLFLPRIDSGRRWWGALIVLAALSAAGYVLTYSYIEFLIARHARFFEGG